MHSGPMLCTVLTAAVFCCQLAAQGVEITLSVRDLEADRQLPDDRLFAQNGSIRIQTQEEGRPMTVIFSGGDFIYQDDAEKSFVRMNGESARQTGNRLQNQMGEVQRQMAEAMKQAQAELEKLDPEQRAMIENLMKGGLAGMQAGAPPRAGGPPARRVEAGASERVGGIECVVHSVYRGDELVRTICGAAPADVEGAEVAMEAFRNMSRSVEEMMEAFGGGLVGSMQDSGFHLLEEMGNRFPLRMVEYEAGRPAREATYKSSARRELAEDLFAPCGDCREQDPFQGSMGR